MVGYRMLGIAVATLSLGALVATTATASSAQKQKKKVTLEQAWEICRKEVQSGPMATTNQMDRTARGQACLSRFGYRL